MSIKKLKAYLQSQDPECLIDEILTLYRKFKIVQEFYISQLEPTDAEKVIEKYKRILEEQLHPHSDRGSFPKLNYAVARKAISDFKKVNSNPSAGIDLQLTYVEYGVQCTLAYGDIDERFYNSMESMFRNTLADMKKHDLLDQFEKRCLTIQSKTRDLGWGFGDAVTELCQEYFLQK